MKTFKTILAAAFIAGSATVAMAQASGGGAGSDVNPDRINKGADQNPTGPGVNPKSGRTDADTKGSAKTGAGTGMQTAPVAGTQKDSSTPSQAPATDAKKK